MKHVALTLIAPIATGRRDALEAVVAALPTGPQSPFATIPGLHVGRVSIIDHLVYPAGMTGGQTLGPYLFVGVDADGPHDGVVSALGRALGPALRECEGCPDPTDDRAFAAWVRDHRVRDGWTIMPYAGRTLAEVRAALALRDRVGDFATRAQDMDPATLRAQFRATFGTGSG